MEELPQDLSSDFDLIVDAMFGFSFQGTLLIFYFQVMVSSYNGQLMIFRHLEIHIVEMSHGMQNLDWSIRPRIGSGRSSFAVEIDPNYQRLKYINKVINCYYHSGD